MTTWEEAARKVGNEIRDQFIDVAVDPLGSIDMHLEGIRDGGDPRPSLAVIADDALTVYAVTMNVRREEALNLVLRTIAEKQADYGPQNILWAGVQGIMLRMHDKTARIRNLQARGQASNEPLADSWLDLVGYSIVGIMLIDGTFEYPLARDLPKPTDEFGYTAPDANGRFGLPSHFTKDPFSQLADDPEFVEAVKDFSEARSMGDRLDLREDGSYGIRGDAGSVTVLLGEDDTTIRISDPEGNYIDVTGADGEVRMHTSEFPMLLNSDRMAVVLAIALGACEHSLAWRNTNMTAEVPKYEQ